MGKITKVRDANVKIKLLPALLEGRKERPTRAAKICAAKTDAKAITTKLTKQQNDGVKIVKKKRVGRPPTRVYQQKQQPELVEEGQVVQQSQQQQQPNFVGERQLVKQNQLPELNEERQVVQQSQQQQQPNFVGERQLVKQNQLPELNEGHQVVQQQMQQQQQQQQKVAVYQPQIVQQQPQLVEHQQFVQQQMQQQQKVAVYQPQIVQQQRQLVEHQQFVQQHSYQQLVLQHAQAGHQLQQPGTPSYYLPPGYYMPPATSAIPAPLPPYALTNYSVSSLPSAVPAQNSYYRPPSTPYLSTKYSHPPELPASMTITKNVRRNTRAPSYPAGFKPGQYKPYYSAQRETAYYSPEQFEFIKDQWNKFIQNKVDNKEAKSISHAKKYWTRSWFIEKFYPQH